MRASTTTGLYPPETQSCYPASYSYNRALGQFDGQSGFYSIADSFSNGVIPYLSSGKLTYLFNYIYYGYGDTGEIIGNSNVQAGPIIAESVGALFVLISAVFAISFFCRKCICCCCTKPNRKVQTFLSTRAGYLTQVILYLILFGFILAGTIIYGLSVEQLDNGINWNQYRYSDNYNYNQGKRDLNCAYKSFVATPFDYQKNQVNQIPDAVTGVWLNDTGILQLNQFDEVAYKNDLWNSYQMGANVLRSLNNLDRSSSSCNNQIDYLKILLANLNNDTNNLYNYMYQVQSQTTVTLKDSARKDANLGYLVSQPSNQQAQVLQQIQDRLFSVNLGLLNASTSFQSYADTFGNFITRGAQQWSNNGKQDAVRIVSQLVVVIPMSLIMLGMIVAFVVCVFRFFFPRVHIPIIFTGPIRLVIGVGAYTVIFTAWMIWLVAMAYYWVSNPFASTCYEVQPVPDYSFFKLSIPYTYYTSLRDTRSNKNTYSVQYGAFYQSLTYSSTLYSSLTNSAGDLIQLSVVLDDLNNQYYNQQSRNVIDSADISVSFDQQTYNKYQILSNSLTSDTLGLDSLSRAGFLSSCNQAGAQSVKNSLYQYTSKLDSTNVENVQLARTLKTVVNSGSNEYATRYDMKAQSSTSYDNLQYRMIDIINAYTSTLSNQVYPSQAMTIVYDSTWDVLCSQIRSPLDGIWASAGMLAIFMIPAGFLLYKTSRVVVGKKKPTTQNAETHVNEGYFATAPVEQQPPTYMVATVSAPPRPPPPDAYTTVTVVETYETPAGAPPPMIYPTIDPNALNNLEVSFPEKF